MSRVWVSHVARMSESTTPHIQMSHVARMSESTTPHIEMSHVARMSESCRAYEWVVSHLWVLCMFDVVWVCVCERERESPRVCMCKFKWCHAHEWVMSHICMGHIIHVNGSSQAYGWVMWHIDMILTCLCVYESANGVLQCVAVCRSVLQCVAECCSVLPCVAVCRSVSQCVAECCSALQCESKQCHTSWLPCIHSEQSCHTSELWHTYGRDETCQM